VCLAGLANGLKDPDERRLAALRARAVLLRAKALGDNSELLQRILSSIPEDGALPGFSSKGEVEELMRAAEVDFAKGNLDRAREQYAKALQLDPTLYHAALFAGDACYKQKKHDDAGAWFAKAIQIDPNQETAYRYWGDSLMAAGQMSEARAKFIEAVIAQPYDRTARAGLTQWASRNRVQFRVVQLKQLATVTTEGNQSTITIDPTSFGKPGITVAAASIVYGGTRIGWQRDKFKQMYPDEPTYRHSLKEEAEALDSVVAWVKSRRASDKSSTGLAVDPELAELVGIRDAGLLEAYILLFRPTAGIAQDYAAYRATNREKLIRFMDEFVVPRLRQ
jgi:tetratricopeptide (TPR) repeat protein